jgi:hypothetical protein
MEVLEGNEQDTRMAKLVWNWGLGNAAPEATDYSQRGGRPIWGKDTLERKTHGPVDWVAI